MNCKTTEFDAALERVCLEQTAELPVEADFSVADYLGEIKKILKCRGLPSITAKQLSGNSAIIEGTVLVTVIYEDREGMLCSAEYEQPFKKSFEANTELENGSCEVQCTAVMNSCRAVTERKLSVKGSLKLNVTVSVIESKTIIADIDAPGFETLRGETDATIPLGITEKSVVIDEELELEQDQPSIRKIIRTGATVQTEDCKILTGKVMISGELLLCILYCDRDGAVQKLNRRFPFSQIVDIPAITEDCKCEVNGELCSLNLTTRTDAEGECRSVAVVSRILLVCKACCSQNVPVIFDAYSIRFRAEFKTEDVNFARIIKQSNETFLCKKKISFPADSVRTVNDVWCELAACSSKQTEKGMMISGTILCSAIHKNETNEYGYTERFIDFEYPVLLDRPAQNPFCSPQIKILGCDHQFSGRDEAEVSIQLMIKACVYDTATVRLITEMNVDDDENAVAQDTALIAYYAESGEDVWQICKRFSANRQELLELNELHEDQLTAPRMLLIPRL